MRIQKNWAKHSDCPEFDPGHLDWGSCKRTGKATCGTGMQCNWKLYGKGKKVEKRTGKDDGGYSSDGVRGGKNGGKGEGGLQALERCFEGKPNAVDVGNGSDWTVTATLAGTSEGAFSSDTFADISISHRGQTTKKGENMSRRKLNDRILEEACKNAEEITGILKSIDALIPSESKEEAEALWIELQHRMFWQDYLYDAHRPLLVSRNLTLDYDEFKLLFAR